MAAGRSRAHEFRVFDRGSAFPLRELPPTQALWSGGECAENARSYAPAYFDGSFTVRRLRPFLRRRLSTSRPHFVDMRRRNPCLRILFLFLGLYVGFPITTPGGPEISSIEAAKPIHISEIVQVSPYLLAVTSVDLSTSVPVRSLPKIFSEKSRST